MKKYSCKGRFPPLIRKEVRRHEKKTNTEAWGMPSLSWEENQRCTVIFRETINASPFWIRQMTARTAPQLGVSRADRCWIWDASDGPVKWRQCSRWQASLDLPEDRAAQSVDAWFTVPRIALTAARGSHEISLNYRISLDPLYPFSRSPHPAARPSLLPSTFRLSPRECWDGACSSSQLKDWQEVQLQEVQ